MPPGRDRQPLVWAPRYFSGRRWLCPHECTAGILRPPRFKRPLLVGLIFIFDWEQAALAFPGYLKKFTIAYYLQALVPHAMPNDSLISLIQGVFRESPGLVASLIWLAVIWAICLILAAWVVERKEYVLEQ